MITHIVQWRVREEADGHPKARLIEEMQQRLEALNGVIPEIITLSVGINAKAGEQASDIVLLSTFADWEALQRYVVHPAHQEVAKFIGAVVTERRVVDFEN